MTPHAFMFIQEGHNERVVPVDSLGRIFGIYIHIALKSAPISYVVLNIKISYFSPNKYSDNGAHHFQCGLPFSRWSSGVSYNEHVTYI